MSAVTTTPSAKPKGESGRIMSRIRDLIIRVRRAGVPHEETVIIPAVTLNVIVEFWKPEWPNWISSTIVVGTFFMCGAWLALAWWRFHVARVILRTLYISILAVALWLVSHDHPDSKHEAVRWIITLWLVPGQVFFLGYAMGGSIRDAVLGIFYSDKHRFLYLQKKEWRSRIWRLVREKEDPKEASNKDYIIAKLLGSVIDVKGLLALIGAIGSIVYYFFYGLPLPPSGH